jgi:hypothetical protein
MTVSKEMKSPKNCKMKNCNGQSLRKREARQSCNRSYPLLERATFFGSKENKELTFGQK